MLYYILKIMRHLVHSVLHEIYLKLYGGFNSLGFYPTKGDVEVTWWVL